jgi:DNA-binding response OmpR family regulator
VRRVGAIKIDTAAREVRVAGARVKVSAMEFALVGALASDPRRVFTKDELPREVWGFRSPGRRHKPQYRSLVVGADVVSPACVRVGRG